MVEFLFQNVCKVFKRLKFQIAQYSVVHTQTLCCWLLRQLFSRTSRFCSLSWFLSDVEQDPSFVGRYRSLVKTQHLIHCSNLSKTSMSGRCFSPVASTQPSFDSPADSPFSLKSTFTLFIHLRVGLPCLIYLPCLLITL